MRCRAVLFALKTLREKEFWVSGGNRLIPVPQVGTHLLPAVIEACWMLFFSGVVVDFAERFVAMAGSDNNNAGAHHLPLYKQGAEARVYESTFLGKKAIVKERFSKKYRHPVLDVKLTQKRLAGEARTLTKARKLGVVTPALYAVDLVTNSLTFEYVQGPLVKDVLLQSGPLPTPDGKIEELAGQIGRAVAKLHDGGLVHGDLTTSNMIVCANTGRLVLIDFGLGYNSTLPEDKAVDLYVLERACIAMHSSVGDFNGLILAAYNKSSKYWSSTYNKLAAVRLRGRKRVMVG